MCIKGSAPAASRTAYERRSGVCQDAEKVSLCDKAGDFFRHGLAVAFVQASQTARFFKSRDCATRGFATRRASCAGKEISFIWPALSLREPAGIRRQSVLGLLLRLRF